MVVERVQIRDFAQDRHRSVDDYSFGGGPGMVMKGDVLQRALQSVVVGTGLNESVSDSSCKGQKKPHVVYLSPQGGQFVQRDALRLSQLEHLVLICGHYEGVDERFVDSCVDEELSIGDFVLTGGEIPAMVVVDAVARLLPGVLGDAQSFRADSFYDSLLDHPHYTRPANWAAGGDDGVPAVLLSGNHLAVAEWRRRQSLLRTLIRRPDLLNEAGLSRVEKRLLRTLAQGLAADLDVMKS